MMLATWPWTRIALVSALYWLLLTTGWRLWVARPARQAQARAAAEREVRAGRHPGEAVLTLSGEVHVGRWAGVVLGPPLLLALLRALG